VVPKTHKAIALSMRKSYKPRTSEWYPVKFDGKNYKTLSQFSQRLREEPKNIIFGENSPAFDLGNFPGTQSVTPVAAKPITKFNITNYQIRNFQQIGSNFTKDLGMTCGTKVNLYVANNKKSIFHAEECSAFFLKDSYYKEYVFQRSVLRSQSNNQINMCSASKPIFIGSSYNYRSAKLDKCQILTIRSKDNEYIYAGYVTPTNR
jgi:hypothetical protein